MPLPLLLVGIGISGMAALGVKKTADAIADNSKAKSINEDAQSIYEQAEKKLVSARKTTARHLKKLGQAKLEAWDEQIGRFVTLFEQIRNVQLTGEVQKEDFNPAQFTAGELAEMREVSLRASEVVVGGLQALGTGALVGIASYGGATMFASASTGTAIATLSGIAAKNATLAWFGGGSLAAGGLGVAGGTIVLGGIVAAPVLAVGGMVLAAKARKNLAAAEANLAEAERAAEEMKSATSVVRAIGRVAREYSGVVDALRARMDQVLDDLETIIARSGTNYEDFTLDERKTVHLSVQFAQAMKLALETPILTEQGALHPNCRKPLKRVQRFLTTEAGEPAAK